MRRALRRREASLLRRAPVVRRASYGLQRQAGFRVPRASAPRRSLSLGRRRSTQASCCARAVPRWLWSASAPKQSTAPARGLSPPARAVVRRASCGLQRQASAACSRGAARLRSLSLGRRRSTRACCARAPCRAGCGRSMPTKGTAPARGLSPSARARGATCQLRPPTPSQRRVSQRGACACARCLWGGGAALELATRARRAALVVVGRAHKEHCAGERPLSFGARLWCDVPAAASNAKQRRLPRSASRAVLAVSGEEAQHSSLLRARAVPRWLWSAYANRRALRRREASLLLRARVVRRASCGLQRASRLSRRTRECARRSLSLEMRRSTRACCARAVPRWLWSARARTKDTAPARGLSLRRAPVVRRASCSLQRQASAACHTRAARAALAVSGRRRSTRAFCARAVPRWLRSALCLSKEHCAGERPLSSGARPWCDVPAAASNAKPAPRVRTQRARCARCLWGGGAALELAARARRAALVVVDRCL